MMKRLVYIFIIAVVTFSCKNSKKVSIEGTIKNASNFEAQLEEINDVPFVIIDKSKIENNQFKISNYIKNEGLYRLSFGEQAIYLFLDGDDNLKIQADLNDLSNYTISGNKESESISTFIKSLDKFSKEFTNLHIELNKATEKDSLETLFEQKHKSYIQYVKDFATNEKSPEVAIFALNFLGENIQDEMPFVVDLVEKREQQKPNSIFIKKFSEAIQQYKASLLQGEQGGLGIGNKAPEIRLPNWNGDTIALSSLQGKYILLDFWASWCPPCRQENPSIVAAYNQYKNKGFDIYSVSLDQSVKPWKNAIEKDQLTWQSHVSDLKGWASSAAQLYQVESIPTSYLLDKNGVIIAKNLRGNALHLKLKELLDNELANQ